MTATAPIHEVKWLACQLDKGMFSDELAVTYPSTGTTQKSVFVPQSDTEGIPGSLGKVRVKLVRNQGKLLAVLPSATQDIIFVQEADLV